MPLDKAAEEVYWCRWITLQQSLASATWSSMCSHLVVPDTATFSASDKSDHTVVFPTTKAYISYKDCFAIPQSVLQSATD